MEIVSEKGIDGRAANLGIGHRIHGFVHACIAYVIGPHRARKPQTSAAKEPLNGCLATLRMQ